MLFNSLPFLLLFWPLCFFGFYASRRLGKNAPVIFLTLASLFFYGCWNPVYLPLLVGLIAVNALLGKAVLRSRGNFWLVFGIILNLSCLGYFKYADFFIENANAAGAALPYLHVVLPLGISFFIFQKISYLVDCRRGLVTDRGFWNYALFVSLFPQLIAGPIVRFTEVSPQFADENFGRMDAGKVANGLFLFCIGLFKKVIFADGLAQIAAPVFARADGLQTLSGFEAWSGLLAYAFQIYFDFSGYSDMAIGLGLMLGLAIPQNFFSPYKSASIIDFWRTWHMTLSRFLRDYLYVPLGGSQRGGFRRYVNLTLVMLLGGLWHGASWNFVIWGGLHGFYLMANHAARRLFPQKGPDGQGLHCAKVALTFLCVMAAWAFFRAKTASGAAFLLSSLFAPLSMQQVPPLLLLCAFTAWLCPNSMELSGWFKNAAEKSAARIGFACAALLTICLFFIYAGSPSEFIYFQF